MTKSNYNAEFFDGKSAAARLAHVAVSQDSLVISPSALPQIHWPLHRIELVSGGKPGQVVRLKLRGDNDSRLTLPEGPTADSLLATAPSIFKAPRRRFWTGVAIAIATLVAILATGYATLAIAPQALARFIPDEVVDTFADGLERSVIKSSRRCSSAEGLNALNKIVRRVVSGIDDPPTFSVRVFDIRTPGNKKMINAFALPGGRMVLAAGLIEKAESADEVAGVLAHELGHVAYRHPEAAIVRVFGLQMLLSLFTTGQGAETITSLAGVLAVLRYNRAAESQADAFAVKSLTAANVDPMGLQTFFARMQKMKTAAKAGKQNEDGSSLRKRIEPLTDLFATHPGTGDRIATIKPLSGGTRPAILSEAEWTALRKICG